jgi:predicted nucleic acid-binding protein
LILVDTSVWIDAFRHRQGNVGRALVRLLDSDLVALAAPVRIEILAGASRADLPRLRRSLSALPIVFPTDRTWSLLDSWTERAVGAGERFGFADLLIGVLAAERGWKTWSLDGAFQRMGRLGLLELHDPESLA